jgi:hypothetical protein
MNSCGTSSPRAVASNARKWVDRACFLLPFPSLPTLRTTVTCNKRKDTTRSFGPFPSRFLDLLLHTDLFYFSFGFAFFSISGGQL